jgi:hypothetical protein
MQGDISTLPACSHVPNLACRVAEADPRIADIRKRVEAFATTFPMPGFPVGPVANGHVHVAPAVGLKPHSNGVTA